VKVSKGSASSTAGRETEQTAHIAYSAQQAIRQNLDPGRLALEVWNHLSVNGRHVTYGNRLLALAGEAIALRFPSRRPNATFTTNTCLYSLAFPLPPLPFATAARNQLPQQKAVKHQGRRWSSSVPDGTYLYANENGFSLLFLPPC
jgi:hypothetical protein